MKAIYKPVKFFLCLQAIALIVGIPAVYAQTNADWAVGLTHPASGYYGPQDELRMTIPSGISVEELRNLKLEVDGIDVTAFIERDGGDAVYMPVQPLAWGNHEIRVVEYTPDGEILERGEWTFEVRKTKAFREAALNANLTLTGNKRIAQRNLNTQVNSFTGNGSLQMNGAVAEGIWKAQATGDVAYIDSQGNQGDGNRSVDVGSFLVSAQGGPLTLQAGVHSVSADNLLLQNGLTNRGVSATLATKTLYSSVTGFAMRSSPVTGFKHGFAISNPDDRIQGVTFQSYPLANETGTIKVTGVYIDGNDTQTGDATGGYTTTTGGNGFGGTIDSVFFSNRLRVRGEYARTRFDFDGKSGSLTPLTDHAYTVLGSLKILDGVPLLDSPLEWTLGLQRRYFGTNFHSVADRTGGIFDTKVTQLFSNANWADISVGGELDQGFDNVNNAAGIGKNRTRFGTLTLGWSPQPNYDDQGLPIVGFFGSPSLSGTVASQQQSTVTPGAVAATGLDTLNNSLMTDATFAYPAWNWHTNYTVAWLSNRVDVTQSMRQDSVTADTTFGLFDQHLTFTPAVELTRNKNKGTGLDTKTIHPSLTTAVALMDGKVNGRITTNVNRTFTNDGLQDVTFWSVNGSLGWQAIQSRGMKPGLLLSLSGNYGDTKDKIDPLQSLSNYQFFVNATIGWNGGI